LWGWVGVERRLELGMGRVEERCSPGKIEIQEQPRVCPA
jgi:hypothetical protein